jgi:CheY-like chemotaxis protein
MNLVVNARDAMPRGGHLTIETAGVGRTEREAGSGQTRSYVLLVVADTGVGMDAQIKPHIFEPFFTTKEADKGTGIGLSTVYEIVRQYGGDIQVESEPGQGAVFSIYWPRVEAPAETGGLVSFPLASHEGTETILVVEDEAEIRQVALKFLQKLGYIVLEAGTAQEAIRLYQQQQGQIDLLITDVVMSGMNGYELASYLAKSKPDLRVLYISGYADEIVRKYGPPPTAVLSKPFSLELLARRVRETLDSFRYETL